MLLEEFCNIFEVCKNYDALEKHRTYKSEDFCCIVNFYSSDMYYIYIGQITCVLYFKELPISKLHKEVKNKNQMRSRYKHIHTSFIFIVYF